MPFWEKEIVFITITLTRKIFFHITFKTLSLPLRLDKYNNYDKNAKVFASLHEKRDPNKRR